MQNHRHIQYGVNPHFYIFYFQEAKVSCYLFSALEQYLLKLSEKPLKFSLDIGCFFLINLFIFTNFQASPCKTPPKKPHGSIPDGEMNILGVA